MRRYNTVPLILLILSIVNFALAAPVLITKKCQVCVDVVHVPKDVITVLGKRADRDDLEKMVRLFQNFDRWWGGLPGPSPPVRLPSSSVPLVSGHGSMQVHSPPAGPASSTEPESVWHPPTPSIASSTEPDSEHESMPSLEPVSDSDREAKSVDHDAPQPSPDSSMESGHSSTDLSTEWLTAPSSPGSDSDSDRWSTISNAPSAESLLRNSQTANDELKGKAQLPRRNTGTARGAVNAIQSGFQYA